MSLIDQIKTELDVYTPPVISKVILDYCYNCYCSRCHTLLPRLRLFMRSSWICQNCFSVMEFMNDGIFNYTIYFEF